MQVPLWEAAAVCAVLAGIAALADLRRGRRRDLDRVGFMPWTGIQMAAMLLAVVLAALAVTTR